MHPIKFLLLLFPCLIVSCPTNDTLLQLCKCESTFNGILLDCSSSSIDDPIDTALTLRILQENRAQLGLIQELVLKNGTLRQLPASNGQPHPFEGLYIKKLDISNNELENVSADAFRGLESVLQILIISKNRLRRFPAQALSNMVSLLQLDLSENEIQDLQETDALRNTPKLFDLNLANNRICSVHKSVFDDLKQSMQTLNLGGNCFEKVPASAVRGFKHLLALHLHSNRIEQLEPLQFMNLPSLNLINLSKNRIEIVHRQSFLNVPNLRFMYLSDNNISQLSANEFRTFENLELLDLTRNRIRLIPEQAFLGMPRLSQLYLGENGIETMEANAFLNSSLVILLLPNNQMTELRSDMFNGLTYLQQFSLKGNKITKISSNAFYQMPSLVVIDLSDNELTTLEPATFLAQLNLFLLDLSRNKLTTTPYNAFNRRIVTVVLQDNPLVCTEHVHVLQNGVGVNVPGTVDNVCGGSQTTSIIPVFTSTIGLPLDPIASSEVPAFVQEIQTPTTEAFTVQFKTPAQNSNSNSIPSITVQHRTLAPNVAAELRPLTIVDQTQLGSSSNLENPGFVPSFSQSPNPFGVDPNAFSRPDIIIVPSKENPGTGSNIGGPVTSTRPVSNIPSGFTQSTSGSVPGFVEQVPLDENQGVLSSNPKSPTKSIDTSSPEFAWTWQTPPRTVFPTVDPVFPFTVIQSPTRSTSARVANAATLPSGVITAELPTFTTSPFIQKFTVTPSKRPAKPWQENSDPLTPDQRTQPPKKHRPEDEISGSDAVASAGDFDASNSNSSGTNATTTIAVCLTVVVVVMISVFITLCIVRHRNHSRRSVSSESRTSAYVAAQAARINYATSTYGVAGPCASSVGTGAYMRDVNSVQRGTLQRAASTAQTNQAWIYAPGTYASPSSYYK